MLKDVYMITFNNFFIADGIVLLIVCKIKVKPILFKKTKLENAKAFYLSGTYTAHADSNKILTVSADSLCSCYIIIKDYPCLPPK